MEKYQDLIVWQKAMEIVKKTYELTEMLPIRGNYSLIDQMRRAAISIPSNIAEGYERNSTKEYVRFLSIANGSKAELAIERAVIAISGEAVKFPHEDKIEQLFPAVLYHALKTGAIVCFGGQRSVYVFPDDVNVVIIGILLALAELSLDTFLSLVFARIAGVNHGFHGVFLLVKT